MADDDTDADLVVRIRAGDLDAVEQLLQRHAPIAYRVALRMLADEQAARDITTQALTAAWRQLPRYAGEPPFQLWFYSIVVTTVLTRLPGRRRDDATGAPVPPAESPTRHQAAVDAAVTDLPPTQRMAVVLHHFEGLSYADVSIATGSAVAEVRHQLKQARRAMTTTLAQWEVTAR